MARASIASELSLSARELDLGAFPCISEGNDSNVYLVGDLVAKEYHTASFAEVARYVALVNASVDVIPRLGYEARITIRGVPTILAAVEVVPVDELAVSRDGKPLTFSRFVEAPTLEKLMWQRKRFDTYAGAQIADPSLRAFGSEINTLFRKEYPTRVQDEFHYHLCMVSRVLDRELGVWGLYIGKYNAKLRPAAGEPGIDLVITDLAVYIDRVLYPEDGS